MAEFTAAKSRKKHCNLAVPSFSVELAPDVFNARLCTSQCTLPALKMDQLWTGRSTPSINTPFIMCKHTKGGKFYIASRLVLSMNKRNRNAFVVAEKVSIRVSLYRLLNPTPRYDGPRHLISNSVKPQSSHFFSVRRDAREHLSWSLTPKTLKLGTVWITLPRLCYDDNRHFFFFFKNRNKECTRNAKPRKKILYKNFKTYLIF